MARPQNSLRLAIAATAARLMAEDGIDDFAQAKRKAARQLGASESHGLPGNDEIERELRTYQSLYQGEEQTSRLRELRQLAATIMQDLAEFHPFLTGQVLSGTAGRFGGINLLVFTDDAKALELLFLARSIEFRSTEQRRVVGEQLRIIPALELDWQGTPITLSIFGARDERAGIRSSLAGRNVERAALPAVLALLNEAASAS